MKRRDLLAGMVAWGIGAGITAKARAADVPGTGHTRGPGADRFEVGLNTATLRAHKLPLVEVVDIAAKAGYQAIEPWLDELTRHVEAGGSLDDLRKRIADQGLAVIGTVAFCEWMVEDGQRRARALDQAARAMEMVRAVGGRFIAAPPAGEAANVDLLRAAERYRAFLELGGKTGVVPALEIWGPAKNLFRLGQAVAVAIEAQHPDACVLPDVFHLHRGGSGFAGIPHVKGELFAGFHVNDYPADPPRETIGDKDRVYPGDGVAPLAALASDLRRIGYRGPVSVELFNPEYARQDPFVVARTAREKTERVFNADVARRG